MTDYRDDLSRLAAWAGVDLPSGAVERLVAFEKWIREEAIPGGGVGPNEATRLWHRHILDSALFAGFVADGDSVLDIGSGVGLPGIPTAVVRPDCDVTLLDRAGRRCDLARRAVRVLGLRNVQVVQGEVAGYAQSEGAEYDDVVIARASLAPQDLLITVQSFLPWVRRVVAAGSWISPPRPPQGWESVAVPPEVVGEKVWLLNAWISADSAGYAPPP